MFQVTQPAIGQSKTVIDHDSIIAVLNMFYVLFDRVIYMSTRVTKPYIRFKRNLSI